MREIQDRGFDNMGLGDVSTHIERKPEKMDGSDGYHIALIILAIFVAFGIALLWI